MDTREYVVCRLCGKNFKMITATHLKKDHDTTIEEYKKEFPEAQIICGARIEQMGEMVKNRKPRAPKPVIEEIEKETFSEQTVEELIEIKNHQVINKPKIINNNETEIAVNKYIKMVYPTAIEDYVVTIKNSNGEILYEFVTDIAVPEIKLIFDFPNSFFHNGYAHVDLVRNTTLKLYDWEFITLKQKMPKPTDVESAIQWDKFKKAKNENFIPNTDLIDNN